MTPSPEYHRPNQQRSRRLADGCTVALLIFLTIFAACLGPAARAQPAAPLSLDDLLITLEGNLRRYDAKIPSLFADEHVVSSRFPGIGSQVVVTDSIFRLRRALSPEHRTILEESREVKTIDGHSVESENIAGPVIVIGAFSGGLAVVSSSQTPCMNYILRPYRPGHRRAPYEIRFKSLYNQKDPKDCLLREEGSGRVFIDPITMQITRMELTAPKHIIVPEQKSAAGELVPAIVGEWILAVDYAPVVLGGQTFWLPRTITSHATTGSGGPGSTVWTFKAQYSNYHKLEVTSRILPAN